LYLEFQSRHDHQFRAAPHPNFSARPDIPGGHLDRVGVNFPVMKYLLSEWPPLSSRGLTGIVGAAALALIAVLQRQSLAVPHKMRLRLVLVSLLAITSWVALLSLRWAAWEVALRAQ